MVESTIKSRKMNSLEDDKMENICFELNLKIQKWLLVATYNPPSSSSEIFQNSIIDIVDKGSTNYDNFILIGDLNLAPDDSPLLTILSTLGL